MSNEIYLNYIDKLWDSLQTRHKSLNSSVFLQTILSLILISLSFGLVVLKKDYSILGMTIITPSVLVLLGGIFILVFLYTLSWTQLIHSAHIRDEIYIQYKKIGFVINFNNLDRSIITVLNALVDSGKKAETLLEKLLALPFLITAIFIIFILPLIAILVTGVKLLIIFHFSLWMWIVVAVSLYTPLGYIFFRSSIEGKQAKTLSQQVK